MTEHKCPVCGRRFYTHNDDWLYKLTINNILTYFCRYKCWRQAQAERDEKRKQNQKRPRKGVTTW